MTLRVSLAIVLATLTSPLAFGATTTICSPPVPACGMAGTLTRCRPEYYGMAISGSPTVVSSTNVSNCNVVPGAMYFTIRATAMSVDLPEVRVCNLRIPTTGGNVKTCMLTNMDGLPVELLEFSVDDTSVPGADPSLK